MQAVQELDDAVRALRRPTTWRRERAQVSYWAGRLLADDSVLAVNTGIRADTCLTSGSVSGGSLTCAQPEDPGHRGVWAGDVALVLSVGASLA